MSEWVSESVSATQNNIPEALFQKSATVSGSSPNSPNNTKKI